MKETYTARAGYNHYHKQIELDIIVHEGDTQHVSFSMILKKGDALLLAIQLEKAVDYQLEDGE